MGVEMLARAATAGGWDATAIATLVVAVATMLVAGATLLLVHRTKQAAEVARDHIEEAARATLLASSLDLMREYRSGSMLAARWVIRNRIPDHAPGMAIYDLPRHQVAAAVRVSHFLDSVGALVHQELLQVGPARSFLGGSTLEMWAKLGPFILEQRRRDGVRVYQMHFEHLASLMSEGDIEAELLATLRTLDPSDVPYPFAKGKKAKATA
jgi:hypothetical protein